MNKKREIVQNGKRSPRVSQLFPVLSGWKTTTKSVSPPNNMLFNFGGAEAQREVPFLAFIRKQVWVVHEVCVP